LAPGIEPWEGIDHLIWMNKARLLLKRIDSIRTFNEKVDVAGGAKWLTKARTLRVSVQAADAKSMEPRWKDKLLFPFRFGKKSSILVQVER
jgi:hypothetical protein